MTVSRYFRFRVRTLLVLVFVVSLLFWRVAYCLHWIKERDRFIHAEKYGEQKAWSMHGKSEGTGPPWQLAPFGDEGFIFIKIGDWAEPGTVERVQLLFPEATVSLDTPPTEDP